MTLSAFPGEIIARIFSYLHIDNLYECMRVCKSWYREGSVGIYKDITLYSYHVRFLKRTNMIHADHTRIGDFVETITINPRATLKTEVLTQEQFNLLLFNLPKLRVLQFKPKHDLQTIVNYLIYFKIIARYTRIEQVLIPDFKESNKKIRKIRRFHYMANRILHNQITSLALHDLDIRMLKHDSRRTVKSLAKFNSLKHLSLYNRDTRDFYASRTDLNLTSVLNACPHLETLEFNSSAAWVDTFTASSSHEIYPQLTSLTLTVPSLREVNVEYLMRRVPNLKRLNLKMFFASSLSELCGSLGSARLAQFVSYIKQLDFLRISSGSDSRTQEIDLFWDVIRRIYDSSMRCNLHVDFRPPRRYNEEVSFDRHAKTFNVYCEWILVDELKPTWTQHIDYFNFASVQIENHNRVQGKPLMLDLMQPVLLEQRPFVSILNNGSRIILDDKMLGFVDEYKRRYDRPVIRCAYLSYLSAEQGVLPLIGSYNPLIEKITMVHCEFPKESQDKNHYLIDLRSFKDVHEFAFDVDAILANNKALIDVYIRCKNENKSVYYCYSTKDGSIKKMSNIQASDISESSHLVSIHYLKMRQFVFKRHRDVLPIVQG